VLIIGFSGSAAGFWFGFVVGVVLAGFHISFYILSVLMVMRSQLLFRPLLYKTYWLMGDNQVRRRHVDNQTPGYPANSRISGLAMPSRNASPHPSPQALLSLV
jgi:hypothetical protein